METQELVVSSEIMLYDNNKKRENRRRNHQTEAYKAKKAKRSAARKQKMLKAQEYLKLVGLIVKENQECADLNARTKKLRDKIEERTAEEQTELEALAHDVVAKEDKVKRMLEQRYKLMDEVGEKWVNIATRFQQ